MMATPPLAVSQRGREARLEFRSDGDKAVTPTLNCTSLLIGCISERGAGGAVCGDGDSHYQETGCGGDAGSSGPYPCLLCCLLPWLEACLLLNPPISGELITIM